MKPILVAYFTRCLIAVEDKMAPDGIRIFPSDAHLITYGWIQNFNHIHRKVKTIGVLLASLEPICELKEMKKHALKRT